MKKHYLSAKSLCLWMGLTKKWNRLYTSVRERVNLKKLNNLNSLSLLLGVKRKMALTALAGVVTLGAQAQITFEEVTNRAEQTFIVPLDASRPTLADIDGDGDIDLIGGGSNNDYTIHFYENENNVLIEKTGDDSPFDAISIREASPVFTDIDGDGDLDLIVGEWDGTIHYFTNDANVFTEQTGVDNPFDGVDLDGGSVPTFADLDKDGDLDLIIGEQSGTIHFYDNELNVFTEQISTDNPFDGIDVGNYASPTLEDIDGDGDLDLIVGENSGVIKFYDNDATMFTEQTGVDNPFDGINMYDKCSTAFIDEDQDGDLDLIVTGRHGNIRFYDNDANVFNQKFTTDNLFGEIKTYGYAPAIADIDEDGDLDLIVGEYENVIFFENNTTFYKELKDTDHPLDGMFNPSGDNSPTFADLDNDGDLDLIIQDAYGAISYFNFESGVFTKKTGIDNPFTAINGSGTPTFADLDKDGDLELIMGDWQGNIHFYDNENNIFTQQTGVDNPFDDIDVGNSSAPTFADLDNDGDLDLIVGENSGTIKFFQNDANVFSEQTGVDNPFSGIENGYNTIPTFIDIDGDLDLDLFIVNAADKSIVEYRNLGTDDAVGLLSYAKEANKLSIYPNPASSIISTEEGSLQIIDGLGNIVLEIESAGKVDVSSLESGIYFVAQNGKSSKLIIE